VNSFMSHCAAEIALVEDPTIITRYGYIHLACSDIAFSCLNWSSC
jgi:hypothetical protein